MIDPAAIEACTAALRRVSDGPARLQDLFPAPHTEDRWATSAVSRFILHGVIVAETQIKEGKETVTYHEAMPGAALELAEDEARLVKVLTADEKDLARDPGGPTNQEVLQYLAQSSAEISQMLTTMIEAMRGMTDTLNRIERRLAGADE